VNNEIFKEGEKRRRSESPAMPDCCVEAEGLPRVKWITLSQNANSQGHVEGPFMNTEGG